MQQQLTHAGLLPPWWTSPADIAANSLANHLSRVIFEADTELLGMMVLVTGPSSASLEVSGLRSDSARRALCMCGGPPSPWRRAPGAYPGRLRLPNVGSTFCVHTAIVCHQTGQARCHGFLARGLRSSCTYALGHACGSVLNCGGLSAGPPPLPRS